MPELWGPLDVGDLVEITWPDGEHVHAIVTRRANSSGDFEVITDAGLDDADTTEPRP